MENYEYIGDLGSGSYGFVWKCLQRSSGKIVAVKGFKLAHTDKKFLDQAIREVRMLRASCNHPNVVQLLEAFRSSSGRVYMVFEYVDRCVSSELHKRFTCGLPASQTRLVLWQLLCAVTHLHSMKIIHRDIKPGNLLITSDGVLKLCDFGFARTTRGEPYQPDRFSSYVVTRWYRSPEMLVSDLYSAASDIWSLGCTFAEIATGRPLFPGTSSLDQLWRIMRCLGSLPPSQAERFAAAAKAAGLPEPPPPPPRGKSLWQRLPELENRLLDVVQACLRLDPAQRPSAAQLLQMSYFWEIPKLIVGTPLEKMYDEHGAFNGRPGTAVGRGGKQQNEQQQQHDQDGLLLLQQQQTVGAPAVVLAPPLPPAAVPSSRGVAVTVMNSEELLKEGTCDKGRHAMSTGDGCSSRRPASVLLSAVAASLLGESEAAPGGSGDIQLVPLLAAPVSATLPPPTAVIASAAPPPLTPQGSDAGTAPPAAAAPTNRSTGSGRSLPPASTSFRKCSGMSLSGLSGQPTSPSASLLTSPQPPTGSRSHNSGVNPIVLPPLTRQPSRQVASLTPMPPTAVAAASAAIIAHHPHVQTPSEMGVVGVVDGASNVDAGVAALVRGRSSTCDGAAERPQGRTCTEKRLVAIKDVPMLANPGQGLSDSGNGAGATIPADHNLRATSKIELISPQTKQPQTPEGDSELLVGGGATDQDVGHGIGLGLLPDDPDDILSDGDGQISEDDELMEYFATKSTGTASGGVALGGRSRQAMTGPTLLPGAAVGAPSSTAGSGGGAAAATAAMSVASSAAVNSSASLRRVPIDGLHAGVHGVHHGLYGARQGNNGRGSLPGVPPANRHVMAMVLRTADNISSGGGCGGGSGGGDGGGSELGSPQQPLALKHAKRVTVGSYLTMPSQSQLLAGEPQPAAAVAVKTAAVRPRTGGFTVTATTDGGLYRPVNGAGVGASGGPQAPSVLHGGLPALHTHQMQHIMTTTTGTGLAASSGAPHTTSTYGRTSVPSGSYTVTGLAYNGSSANTAGSGRRRALSRQVSVVFNQLMYDALPEIGTPGGAPDVPAGTPPRRRVVMSGFTPCRTAAARAAAEGIPPAAAMAAVLGDVLQSTMTDISVAYSPIHMNRSIDLLSTDRESGPHCDITTLTAMNAAAGGGGGGGTAGAATAAAVALRRHHRRQASMASLQEPGAIPASTGASGGVATTNAVPTVVASAAGYHYQAAATNSDPALVLGSSAPTIYNHRIQRPQEPGAATISSGTPAIPVQIPGVATSRSSFALASNGNVTPLSGTRAFQQTPLTPAMRSRLASGNMARDSQGPSGYIPRDADAETQSTELDPLGTWGGASFSPAGGSAAAAAVALQPQQPQPQPCGTHNYTGPPPPPVRGRLGRWGSGLIDSLPEDREVLHMAYGDWRGSYNDGSIERCTGCDDAIQMLGADGSADWGAAAAAATGALSSGGTAATSAVASPSAHQPLSRGPAGPWPPGGYPRTVRSGSGIDPRVSAAAAAMAPTAAAPPPPPIPSSSVACPPSASGSPRMISARSRRHLQMAAAVAAAAATATAAPSLPSVADTAAAAATASGGSSRALSPSSSSSAAASAVRARQSNLEAADLLKREDRSSSGGDSDGRRASGSSGKGGSSGSGGRWPRAKAFLGGRIISSLVKKFKEQTSEK